jgi:uncharacterized protein YutE (UPF0331/DUF86 family)
MPIINEMELAAPDVGEVMKRLTEVRKLATAGHFEPSLLLGWATLEAVARAVVSEKFAKPQSPGRIVETLAMDGYITPTEADQVRALVTKRNRLIHGALDVRVSATEIENFVRTIERLYELVTA